VDEFYTVGEEVDGLVTRLVPFGAFVALDHGIEGIIPNSELADHRIRKPDEVVNQNQKVRVKIVHVRPAERRMTLSLRQVTPLPEDEISGYKPTEAPGSGVTIGDMLGNMFIAADEPDEIEVVDETVVEVVETAPEVVETAPEVVETVPEVVETAPEVVETAPEVEDVVTDDVTEEVVAEAAPEAAEEATTEDDAA
jgi:predicted RNA-binding protein with RPS1 domain